jgi:hypothetical protein
MTIPGMTPLNCIDKIAFLMAIRNSPSSLGSPSSYFSEIVSSKSANTSMNGSRYFLASAIMSVAMFNVSYRTPFVESL